MRRTAAALACLLGLALACVLALGADGCGGIISPDLFIVQRNGSTPGAALTLLVNEEGGVRCNGVARRNGRPLKLADRQLVQARAIQEELQEPAARHTAGSLWCEASRFGLSPAPARSWETPPLQFPA